MCEDRFFVRPEGDKPRECRFTTARELTPCWPLEQALGSTFDRGTRAHGLKLVHLVNRTTHKFSRHSVVLKSGELGRRGSEITFCPFCRAPMSEEAEELVAELAAKATGSEPRS